MKKGFTVIEVMIVIAILGIISAIMVPTIVQAKYKVPFEKWKEEHPEQKDIRFGEWLDKHAPKEAESPTREDDFDTTFW